MGGKLARVAVGVPMGATISDSARLLGDTLSALYHSGQSAALLELPVGAEIGQGSI